MRQSIIAFDLYRFLQTYTFGPRELVNLWATNQRHSTSRVQTSPIWTFFQVEEIPDLAVIEIQECITGSNGRRICFALNDRDVDGSFGVL